MTTLPDPVAAALASARPTGGRRGRVPAAGVDWATLEWGDRAAPPVLLVHGVTSSAETWWRVGPALAATQRRVVAVDLPGHGRTGAWSGRHRFADTAADLAAFAQAAGLAGAALDIVGHSWGGMVVGSLDGGGVAWRRRVLLDPPAMTRDEIAALLDDPLEQRLDDRAAAISLVAGMRPDWSHGDVLAKAHGLTTFDPAAVRAVLLDNDEWDGGLRALAATAGEGGTDERTWLVRGDPLAGGFVPDEAATRLAALLPPGRIVTIEGAPHSPMRTHPVETVAALLRAIG